MRISVGLWLGLALGLVGGAFALALSSPGQRAELGWALYSMARPADRPGVRLQR